MTWSARTTTRSGGRRAGTTAPARTELSDRIAAELKARGFKFLGSVTIYAFMQSVGLVNDHARFCFRYKELRKEDGAK